MKSKVYILSYRFFEQLWTKDLSAKIGLFIKAPIFGILVILAARKDVYFDFNDTNLMLFILSFSTFFLGMSNTLQEVCKERTIVKRELQSKSYNGLSYIGSKLVVFTVISIIQTVLLVVPVAIFVGFPGTGVTGGPLIIEVIMTTFLSMLAATAIGLYVSACAKTTESTMIAMPLLFLGQLIFSGVFIKISSIPMKIISYFTVSKWSMQAFGTSCNLNELYDKTQNLIFEQKHDTKIYYVFEASNLFSVWGILLVITFVFCIFSALEVNEFVNDGR